MSVSAPPAPPAAPVSPVQPVSSTPHMDLASDLVGDRSRRGACVGGGCGLRIFRRIVLQFRRRRGAASALLHSCGARISGRVPQCDGRDSRKPGQIGAGRSSARNAAHGHLEVVFHTCRSPPRRRRRSRFGDAYIVLEPPTNPGTATLKAGATIPALQVGQTASLQTTLGDLDNLLIELHPGQLDAALHRVGRRCPGAGHLSRPQPRQGEQLLPGDRSPSGRPSWRT